MTKQNSGLIRLQPVSESKRSFSRDLRKDMTLSEEILWAHLRNNQLNGYKFRRQQVIAGFIADFYCEKAKLVLEVDGSVHETVEQKKTDKHKDDVYKAYGISVMRITNDEIEKTIKSVLMKIGEKLASQVTSPPSPLSHEARGGRNE
ncbi:MAG: DUF559 domain-containing protein [Fibrobacter sp.]|nr:DUF559 domain-containing protein [Fibrobacter sp.]